MLDDTSDDGRKRETPSTLTSNASLSTEHFCLRHSSDRARKLELTSWLSAWFPSASHSARIGTIGENHRRKPNDCRMTPPATACQAVPASWFQCESFSCELNARSIVHPLMCSYLYIMYVGKMKDTVLSEVDKSYCVLYSLEPPQIVFDPLLLIVHVYHSQRE